MRHPFGARTYLCKAERGFKMPMARQKNELQRKNSIVSMVGAIFFTILLFAAVGLAYISVKELPKLSEKKYQQYGNVAVEALMPENQNTKKVRACFEEQGCNRIDEFPALFASEVLVQNKSNTVTDLAVLSQNKEVQYVEGKLKKDGIVLPYSAKGTYEIAIGQKFRVTIQDKSYEYGVTGFYEDAIFSHQEQGDVLAIIMGDNLYQSLEDENVMTKAMNYTIQLEDKEKAEELFDVVAEQLMEQIYIRGLDLRLYSGVEIEKNFHEYLSYVQKACFFLALVFIVISLVGEGMLLMQLLYKKQKGGFDQRQSLLLVEGIGFILGIPAFLVIEKELIAWLLRNQGYGFTLNHVVMGLLVTALCSCLCQVLLFAILTVFVDYRRKKQKSKNVECSGKGIRFEDGIALFLVSIVLGIMAMVITQIYSNTVNAKDLYYEYDAKDNTVEVFHSMTSKAENLESFDELLQYAKPVIVMLTFGVLLAIGILFALILIHQLKGVVRRLKAGDNKEISLNAIPILGKIIAISLGALLIAAIIALPMVHYILYKVGGNLGVYFDEIKFNYFAVILLFGGSAIVSAGITVLEVR